MKLNTAARQIGYLCFLIAHLLCLGLLPVLYVDERHRYGEDKEGGIDTSCSPAGTVECVCMSGCVYEWTCVYEWMCVHEWTCVYEWMCVYCVHEWMCAYGVYVSGVCVWCMCVSVVYVCVCFIKKDNEQHALDPTIHHLLSCIVICQSNIRYLQRVSRTFMKA